MAEDYSYADFLIALKKLPEQIATVAFSEWITSFAMGRDRQKIMGKYVEWAKTPSWAKKPWEKLPWQD